MAHGKRLIATLPQRVGISLLGTKIRWVNLKNGKSVVGDHDRGPNLRLNRLETCPRRSAAPKLRWTGDSTSVSYIQCFH